MLNKESIISSNIDKTQSISNESNEKWEAKADEIRKEAIEYYKERGKSEEEIEKLIGVFGL